MKRILLVLLMIGAITPAILAGGKGKGTKKKKAATAKTEASNEIHWITLDELQVKMKEHPKKVYMDVYTDWCSWCKRMEATTFQNPDLVKYMNDNYYCVRFNAERKDTIRFVGHMYHFEPSQRANTLAVELLRGQMGYPTSVIMEENFLNPQPIAGYQDVPTMEAILKYFAMNIYKSQPWNDYKAGFKPEFRTDLTPQAQPMAGH